LTFRGEVINMAVVYIVAMLTTVAMLTMYLLLYICPMHTQTET
jgi:hypothetical protein